MCKGIRTQARAPPAALQLVQSNDQLCPKLSHESATSPDIVTCNDAAHLLCNYHVGC